MPYSLDELLNQEEQLQFNCFNHETAWALGSLIKLNAEKAKASVAIEIHAFGQTLFSYAMTGTYPDHQQWLQRKKQTVLRFGHSSLYSGEYNRLRNRELEKMPHIDANVYASHGGAFPIIIRNSSIVGVAAVSGLPQLEDHNLVINSLESLIKQAE